MTLPASYCTVADIFSVVPGIGSDSRVTSDFVALEIGKTQARINVALAPRYSVPFSSAPPIIQAIATDLTAKAILEKTIFATNRQADDKLITGFEWAADLLASISSGTATLVDSAGSAVTERSTTNVIWSSTQDYLPTMHEGEWGDMVQDPDKLDALVDDRQ